MTGPKEYIWDGPTADKARSMCARHTDEYISDYLGMAIGQVRALRAGVRGKVGRGRPVTRVDRHAPEENHHWRNDAIIGSAMLAERINEVFGRRG